MSLFGLEQQQQNKSPWKPLPPQKDVNGVPLAAMSAQEFFLRTEEFGIDEVFFTGTTANGKTDALVVHPLMSCGLGYGAKAKYVFVKPSHAAMKDIINKTKLLYPKIDPGAKFYNSKGEQHWVMSTGEEIWFLLLDSVDTYNNNLHGSSWLKIYFDELTTFPDFKLYELMKTRLRFANSNPDLPDVKPQIVSTSNPWGNIKNDVHRYFLAESNYLDIQVYKRKVRDRINGGFKEVQKTKMAIFGSWEENIYLEDTYQLSFDEWKYTNPEMYKALVLGEWDTSIGGYFEGVWDERKIVLPDDFILPAESGYIDRAMDWGTKKPFAIGYFYECNGEELGFINNKIFAPPKGSIIYFAEIYGGSIQEPDKGTNEKAFEVAKKIVKFEKEFLHEYIDGDFKINNGPADAQIWAETGQKISLNDDFIAEGINWHKSKKGRGSRSVGLQKLAQMMLATIQNNPDKPHFYVVGKVRCKHFLNTVPNLQSDEKHEDVVGVDHIIDMVRYRLMEMKESFKQKSLFGRKKRGKKKKGFFN